MLERLRNQIGTAGLVVAIVALVAALGGGAYAATSNSGKATASAKGKQGPRGKTGKTGPAGPAGPQGPAGPGGAKGDKGDTGANGATGPAGAAGPAGPAGVAGPKGDPWTAGGTLPSGAMETGTWVGLVVEFEPGENFTYAPISFPIPLSEGLDAAHVINFSKATPAEKENCENEAHEGAAGPNNPEAGLGYLCVYVANQILGGEVRGILKPNLNPGADAAGAIVEVASTEPVGGLAGTFAVTAE
ncbi:MAG TPA: hypothetical protein VFX85_11130 [Solirubrobacterales bacterium]|nr:hypothetical protein [Solirubrobacterales bacterium]